MLAFIKKITRRFSSSHTPETKAQVEPSRPLLELRKANAGDLQNIVDLIHQEAAQGHFNPALTGMNMEVGSRLMVSSLIEDNTYIAPKGGPFVLSSTAIRASGLTPQEFIDNNFIQKPGFIEVLECDGEFAGFHIIYAERPKTETSAILEYFMLAIAPKFRGKGFATDMVKSTLARFGGISDFMTRCYPQSDLMIKILLKQGFEHQLTSDDGMIGLLRFAQSSKP